MNVYLSTLGCKLNESELESWARKFSDAGCQIVADPRDADLCVLNTCTVTHVAARKSRQMARQLARANPNARLVLTGCFADIAPDEARALPNVVFIVPNTDKDRLVERVSDFRFQISDFADLPYSTFENLAAAQSPTPRTRAFVKIQDGCNMSCAFCIIPLARGRERSRPREEIVAEVQSLVSAGYKEIILTGVQISAYADSGNRQHGLRDLVAAILAETDVPRLRLTSIAPWDLDESLLDLWSDRRLCRHLHLSLQSGSDTILRRMRRPYSTAQFARAADLAREKIPGLGITTDVIVGFPGESDVEFEQSLHFVAEMEFSRVHVFPYSARNRTVAASLPFQITSAVKESRRKQMQAVADSNAQAFARRLIGQTMCVLWEAREQRIDHRSQTNQTSPSSSIGDLWSGYTDNYVRVLATSESHLHNQISRVRVKSIEKGEAFADLI